MDRSATCTGIISRGKLSAGMEHEGSVAVVHQIYFSPLLLVLLVLSELESGFYEEYRNFLTFKTGSQNEDLFKTQEGKTTHENLGPIGCVWLPA